MKPKALPKTRSYYVPHSRYGKLPRITGLDVENGQNGAYIGHLPTEDELMAKHRQGKLFGLDPLLLGFRIPGTAIVADPAKQSGTSFPRTHYYDIERKCRDCARIFIFFAEEQRYWYEELHFPIDADGVRCEPCRKSTRSLAALKARYDILAGQQSLHLEEELELNLARMELVEHGGFTSRALEKVRAFLKRHPGHPEAVTIRLRLQQAELHALKSDDLGPKPTPLDEAISAMKAE